jgi:hypothetical protein
MIDQAVGARRRFVVLTLLGLSVPCAWAQSGIEVEGAWARATVPGQTVGGVYLQIRSSVPAQIVRVTTSDAKSAEIHSMSQEGGVMKMRQLDRLELPAGQTVTLEPGGNHIMLLDLRKPLKPGERVRLTLVIQRPGKKISVPVVAEVKPIAPDGAK